MAGILSVQQIQGLATATDPTTVEISSGHTLIAPGHVIQVATGQDATSGTGLTTSTTTLQSTGLSCTITPKKANSMLLGSVTFNYWFSAASSANYCVSTIYRGTTNLATLPQSQAFSSYSDHSSGAVLQWDTSQDNQAGQNISTTFPFMDKPNSTSALTYTLYCKPYTSSNTLYVNWDSQAASIQIMEIAQ